MALTRRGAAFRELAEAVDRGLRDHEIDLSPGEVDRILNAHVERVAQFMGIQPRQALIYAPSDLPEQVVATIASTLGHH